MTPTAKSGDRQEVTAPNGVIWTRRPGGTSVPEECLRALADLRTLHTVAGAWNWWSEGQQQSEVDRVMAVLSEWDNGAPACTDADAQAFADAQMAKLDADIKKERRARARRAAKVYSSELEQQRLRMLRAESDAAFFRHVARSPATPEQEADAQCRAEVARMEAQRLRTELGRDPETVIDAAGFAPADRRAMNLSSHMHYWRHLRLREWSTADKRRFKALLAMPVLEAEAMCSECQAPASWHDFDISLRLFQPAPEAGSRGEQLARLMPGWWQRCPASTAYNVSHRWGGSHALPDFTGDQYVAILPPLLKTLFGLGPQRAKAPKSKPKPLAVLPPGLPIADVVSRLQEEQQRFPTATVRPDTRGGLGIWR